MVAPAAVAPLSCLHFVLGGTRYSSRGGDEYFCLMFTVIFHGVSWNDDKLLLDTIVEVLSSLELM